MSNIIEAEGKMNELDFDVVYDECKGKVWSLVSRYVSLRQDKEDLFQEVFIKIHRALPRFRGEASVETWIYRIVANTSINYLNKRNRYKKLKEVLSTLRFVEDEVDVEIDESLFKPLEKLNPQQRMIVLLSDVEEIKLDDIAEMLRIPVGTVKSNLHRAREIIKKEVESNGKI
jgi:RNA polymerase sigma-70 factor, ECF subfamily